VRSPGGLRVSLLVFDWDGTLMDSVASIVACMRTTVEELDLVPLSEATIRGTIGLGIRETMEMLCPGEGDERHREILRHYRRRWYESYRHHCVPFPGAPETLHTLRRHGYRLAVATGKGRPGLERELSKTGLRSHFDATRTADEAPSKPDPQMLLEILEDLGTGPDEALMIGDTTFDLEMALHASVGAVGVASGSHPREWLEEMAPLVCLDSVVDVPPWLGDQP
jgi:phosphoglycolate phosphatase